MSAAREKGCLLRRFFFVAAQQASISSAIAVTTTCLIGFGGNLGDPSGTLELAANRLDELSGTAVRAVSRLYKTKPALGRDAEQAEYSNAALVVETEQPLETFFEGLRGIERALGRRPAGRWASRTVDLDLLLFGDCVHKSNDLVVPHPRMSFRRFVLEPAVEIAPHFEHPILGCRLSDLVEHLNSSSNYVALVGLAPEAVDTLITGLNSLQGACFVRGQQGEQPGPALADDIQLLRERMDALSRVRATAPQAWIVSDYWCELPRPTARFIQEDEERWSKLAAAARREALDPKLLVLVRSAAAGTALEERFLGRLWQHIVTDSPRPVLTVDAADPEWALTEIQAAMEASEHSGVVAD